MTKTTPIYPVPQLPRSPAFAAWQLRQEQPRDPNARATFDEADKLARRRCREEGRTPILAVYALATGNEGTAAARTMVYTHPVAHCMVGHDRVHTDVCAWGF